MTMNEGAARQRLTPKDIWGPTWVGPGEYTPAPWLSRFARPSTCDFRTEATWLTEDFFVMHDTTAYAGGATELRDAIAKRIEPHRVRVTYDGVSAGMDLVLREDGFTTRYKYHVPLAAPRLPFIVEADVLDDNYVGTAGEATRRGLRGFEHLDPSARVMHDTLSMSWKGRPIGTFILRLRPEGEAD